MDYSQHLVDLLFAATITTSQVLSGTGMYQFSPSMSQEEACKRAEERAKVQIIQKAYGQDFGSDSSMSCRETDQMRCDVVTNTYENSRGYIKKVKERAAKVDGWACKVEVTAEVQELKPNKSWLDASLQLDRPLYVPTDKAELTVKTNDKGLVSVFIYDPVDDVVTKVFPNGEARKWWTYNDVPLKTSIPLTGLAERDTPYYFLVTVTDVPVRLMDQYRLHNFYEMWDNLQNKDKRLVRKSFLVARSKL